MLNSNDKSAVLILPIKQAKQGYYSHTVYPTIINYNQYLRPLKVIESPMSWQSGARGIKVSGKTNKDLYVTRARGSCKRNFTPISNTSFCYTRREKLNGWNLVARRSLRRIYAWNISSIWHINIRCIQCFVVYFKSIHLLILNT